MAVVKAMVILHGVTGLPKDRFVNTLWFTGPSKVAVADAVQPSIEQFYNGDAPNGGALRTSLSQVISRADERQEVRYYDMADGEPRVPETRFWTLGAAGGSTKLPNEVAICMSFRGQFNRARERGRIYLGPLTGTAAASDTEDARPDANLLNTIASAGEQLLDQFTALANVEWVVHSGVQGANTPVVAGWVDNAFDTIRKRGVQPDSRLEWPDPEA